MLSCIGLGKYFGGQTLFKDVNLRLNPAKRYGVVGANGSGKSTFLRILAGDESATAGEVSLPKRTRLGVLRQDQFANDSDTIINVVMMGDTELWSAILEKEVLLKNAETSFDSDRYALLEDIVLRSDGYSLEARSAEILEGLGIPSAVHHNPLSTLSGGFKLRVLLAQVLALAPDALLLDEPTNHLDIISIRWLERFLFSYTGCAVVISHDHRFLDNISTHILDVDYEGITLYKGGYSQFLAKKSEDRSRREQEIAKQEKEIAEKQAFVDRFKAKATKARQANSRVKQIEKIQVQELARSSRRYPRFLFEKLRSSGQEVLKVKNISKAYGEKRVLEDVTLTINRGDRVAIIGPNGVGKTTLLKIAMAETLADQGESEWGYEAQPGFFPQDHSAILEQGGRHTVESWLWEICPAQTIGFVRGQLARGLFTQDDVDKRVTTLSGGEAARLIFTSLAVKKPNVLVLDEPTNHLDLESIDALTDALLAYEGTLIFVSHDRYFVERLATRVIEILPSGLNDFSGTFGEYLESCGDDHLDATAAIKKAREEKRRNAGEAKNTPVVPRKALSANQRRKLERQRDSAWQEVEEAERDLEVISTRYCEAGFFEKTAADEVSRLQKKEQELRTLIERQTGEWERCEEKLEAQS